MKKDYKKRLTSNKGFTLVELMIVVAIIGIISLVAFPSYKGFKQDRALYADTRKLVIDIRYVQQRALDRNVQFKITFAPDGRSYTLSDPAESDPARAVMKTVALESSVFLNRIEPPSSEAAFFIDAGGLPVGGEKRIVLQAGDRLTRIVYVRAGGKIEMK